MKKTLLICTFIATTLTLFGCESEQTNYVPVEIQSSTPSDANVSPVTPEVTETLQADGYILDSEAKAIALAHAELNESDVTALRVTFEIDDGVPQYEVEFYNGSTEYDYEINALTGAIMGYDYEIEDKFFNIDATTQSGEYISDLQAKEIALAHANLSESDVTALRVKFDFDDGRAEYEVEFYNGNQEYDYEIDAITSEIISFDYEIEEKFYTTSNSIVANSNSTDTSSTTPQISTETSTITSTPSSTTTQTGDYIGEEQAKAIALAHANLSESGVSALRVKFEFDDGVAEYEVEFYVGNKEYDYEINALTGDIRSFDYDIEDKFYTAPSSSTTQTSDYIGEEQAKVIALTHANLMSASNITALRVKFDFDDGVPEYEVEFYVGNQEYDYEINALTGEIIGFDYDIEENFYTAPSTTTQTGNYITEAEAKTIAFNHAGVTESQVSNLKVKIDYDDGRVEYEVEWDIGRTEYDYEINATTGTIISFDIDND